jgi:hypothetical protein
MRAFVVVVLLAACGPKNQQPSGGGAMGNSCGNPPLRGQIVVRVDVNASYEAKDRGSVIEDVRTRFLSQVNSALGGALTFTEAQGQPHEAQFALEVRNDGNNNYKMWGSLNDGPSSIFYLQQYTYTDPLKMVDDLAASFASMLQRGCRGDFTNG